MYLRNWVYALFGFLALFDVQAADCDREDIAFYLSKGFSPEQITRLCTTTDRAGEDTTPNWRGKKNATDADQPTAAPDPASAAGTADYESLNQIPVESESNNPITYLSLAIDGDAVFVTDDKISFQHTVCTEQDRKGGRSPVCPDITLEIDLNGLQVTGLNQRRDGENKIGVAGNIQRKINNYNDLTPTKQRVVDRLHTDKRHRAVIPIREGVDADKALTALKLLVENANPPLVVSE